MPFRLAPARARRAEDDARAKIDGVPAMSVNDTNARTATRLGEWPACVCSLPGSAMRKAGFFMGSTTCGAISGVASGRESCRWPDGATLDADARTPVEASDGRRSPRSTRRCSPAGIVVDCDPDTGQPRSNMIVREDPRTVPDTAPDGIPPARRRPGRPSTRPTRPRTGRGCAARSLHRPPRPTAAHHRRPPPVRGEHRRATTPSSRRPACSADS